MALRITVDVFSGRPNPSWEITDPEQLHDLMRLFVGNRAALAEPFSGYTGLGYRGVRVEITGDTESLGLPSVFEVAGGGAQDPFAGAEIATQLLETMPPELGQDEGNGFGYSSQEFQSFIREEIRRTTTDRLEGSLTIEPGEPPDSELAAEVEQQLRQLEQGFGSVCAFDATPFNPGFWNQPDTQPYNNCYNYAVNSRTNTFAQPGRAHGYTIPPGISCEDVRKGAMQDGLRIWGNCQPPGTKRYVLALVTGTFPGGQRDYHWYRFHPENFWGHKPGGTAARNVDNSNQLIRNPFSCNRAPYDQWCGLLQSHHSVVIK